MKNHKKYFTEKPHKPLFVTLISQWCPHCYQFKPTREKIEHYFAKNKKIDMATISCDSDHQLCEKFPGQGTPRLYITTSTIENAEKFENSRTFEEVKAFIQKYIEPRVIQIDSEDKLNTELKANINSSIFILQDLEGSQLSSTYSSLAEKYVSYPAKFLNLTFKKFDYEYPTIVYYYSPTKMQLAVNNQMVVKKINRFVLDHIYPPYGLVSSTFFSILNELRQPFLVVGNLSHIYSNKIYSMTSQFPTNLKSTSIDCIEFVKFCKQNNFDVKANPWVAMINIYRNTYFTFKGDFNDVESLRKWVNDVWNGLIPEEGPGAGFIGFIRREIIPLFKDYTFYLKLICAIIIIYLFYKMVISIQALIQLRRKRGYHDRLGYRIKYD